MMTAPRARLPRRDADALTAAALSRHARATPAQASASDCRALQVEVVREPQRTTTSPPLLQSRLRPRPVPSPITLSLSPLRLP